ncbi:50S ribosomal protein L25 [Candidatus Nomurabacteria bacterium]|nr:50S ribosomal protein L25 [Candidatus Nomurabacteria bacterium]
MLKLKVERRELPSKLGEIRKEAQIPAVFYGKKEKSTPISVKETDFIKVWRKAGESSVIVLEDGSHNHEALIHDIDLDPVTDKIRHVDFYVIEKGKKVKVRVPIEYVGVSAAVKDLGGTLMKILHDIEIEAKPADLPHNVQVDISTLVDFQSRIFAKDIKLPAGVDLVEKPEEVVALAAEAKKEEEVVEAPVDLNAIEVEKKGKKEEEGVEGAPAPEKAEDKKDKK